MKKNLRKEGFIIEEVPDDISIGECYCCGGRALGKFLKVRTELRPANWSESTSIYVCESCDNRLEKGECI